MKKRNYILIACALLLGLAFALAPFPSLAHADTLCIMTFNANGGSLEYTSKSISDNDNGYILIYRQDSTKSARFPTGTRVGYVLAGWSLNSDGSSPINFVYNEFMPEGQRYYYEVSPPINKTFYAIWEAVSTHTVTFDSQGGSSVPSQTVNSGTSISAPTPPTMSGYTFDGWYTASTGGTKITFPYAVSSNITFYAHWTENITQYTVTFNTQGGSSVPSQTVNSDTSITLPTPTRDGYNFRYWYYQQGTDPISGLPIEVIASSPYTVLSNKTFYAKWELVSTQYTITFNTLGGSSVPSQTVNSGTSISAPTPPTMSGYTFDGWYTGSTGGTKITFPYTITQSIIVYAHWTAEIETPTTYTVTFDSQGGSSVPSQTVNSGTSISAPTSPTKDGYTFQGWYTASTGGTKITFPYAVTQSIIFYARWTVNPIYYKLVLVGSSNFPDLANYDTGSGVLQFGTISIDGTTYGNCYYLNAPAGSVVNLPINILDNDTVVQSTLYWWYIQLSDYETVTNWNRVDLPIILQSDMVIKPYSSFLPCYLLSFDTLGGNIIHNRVVSSSSNGTIIYDIPIKDGSYFLGWFDSPTDGNKYVFPMYSFTSDLIMYAHWSDDAIISFNSNGGSLIDDILLPYGNYLAELPIPIRDGYTFLGWRDELNRAVNFPFAPVTAEITLTAKWELTGTIPISNWFIDIFTSLGVIFSIELFPNITLGLIIGIPLILAVVFFVLKLVRG